MADVITGALDLYNDKINSIAPRAVLIQLGFMAAISLVAIIGFSALRPNNSVVYQPKSKYSEQGKAPPRIPKGFFSWIKPLVTTKEETLINTIGLDAVCFLKFLSMSRNMFVVIALLASAVLIPIDVTYNLRNVRESARNPLSILTIQNVRGPFLWGHVAVVYLITLTVFAFVWVNYSQMVNFRWQYFRSDEYQHSLHARSLIITGVNKADQSDNGLARLLASLNIPYPTTAVHIGRRVGQLPELIEQHNNAVKALEGVLTSYFKNPNSIPAKRPTMKYDGKKVDSIDHLTTKIKRLEERIEVAREQIGDKKAENHGFASFESVPYAHIVGRTLEGKRKHGSRFGLAPAPADILWGNLAMTDSARTRSKIMGTIFSIIFLILYTIPLLAVALMANLASLTTYVGFLDSWSRTQPFLFSAFAGIAPPLLAILLQLCLPIFMRWIASYQGATTHSQVDRIVTSRYSGFLFFSQFFIFSLLGVLVQIITRLSLEVGKKSFGEIINGLGNVPQSLQYTWVTQSTYWLTILPLRGFSAVFDLAQVVALLIIWFRTKLFGRTPREIREATKPPEFDFAVYWANHLLMIVVGFVYAPLAPLVPLFAALAFAASTWVYKYQLMYVCATRVETGGRLWRVAINRVLFALIGMHALMLLTMGLQTGWMNSISLIPAMVLVLIFKITLSKKFDETFTWYIPSDQEVADATLHHADARKNRLQKRFGHPSLNDPLFTPMLHKSVHHLLPTVYSGRISETHGRVDGKSVEGATVGGLTFNMLESRDLEYDRTAYLQGRDEDAVSISTGTVLSAAIGGGAKQQKEGDYFEARRQEYYAGGVGGTPFEDDGYYGANGGTPDGDDSRDLGGYEMKAFESTEQLIQRNDGYADAPYYSPPPPLPPLRTQSSNSTIVGGRHQPDYSYNQADSRNLTSPPLDQGYTQSPVTSSPRQDSRPSSRQDSRNQGGFVPSQTNYQHQPRQQSLSSTTSNVYPPHAAPSYTSHHQQNPSNSSVYSPPRSNSPYLQQHQQQPSSSSYQQQQGRQHARNQSAAMSNTSSTGSSGRPSRTTSTDPYSRVDDGQGQSQGQGQGQGNYRR